MTAFAASLLHDVMTGRQSVVRRRIDDVPNDDDRLKTNRRIRRCRFVDARVGVKQPSC
jgi:hypothetical protein